LHSDHKTGNLDVDEEFCACFIVWQQALDHVNWAKLLQIETGMDWQERIFIRKQYMDQSVRT